jgi:AAA15 family ATPase/GTPase
MKLLDIAKAIIEIVEKEDIQVFITTHDKETIEAFAKASKEVGFKDISSIELYKDEKNIIHPIVMDYDNIIYGIEMGEDFR